MKPRQFKDALYEQFARLGKAVSSPKRLELIDLLGQGPRTVEALADQTGQTVANVSQHLQILRAARLVDARKEGLYVTYRVADDQVAAFFHALRSLAETRIEEVRQITRTFLEERDALEGVDADELVERVRSGTVTVLDVRPAEEFAAAHIPGAVSLPLSELKRRLDSLPKYREVVAYCRGPYCVFAIEAVELLRENGFKAVRMEEGIPEWRARGLPVEVSPER
jgi:rhodanese-related sulfurtransferase/DNA-binding transcriptional ArsR family regulator